MAVTLIILLVLILLLSGSETAMALKPLWSPLDGPHLQEEMKTYSHPDWGLSFLYPSPWTIQEEADIVWAFDFTRVDRGDMAIFAVMAGPGVSGKSLLDVLYSFEMEDLKAEPSMPRSIAGQTGEGAMFQAVEPSTGMAMTGYIALFKRGEMAFALIAMATSDTWDQRWPVLETMINSLSFEGAVVPPSRTPLPVLPTEVPPPAEGPTITTLDPLYGPVGTQVTIQGSGFGPSQGDSLVTFNSIPLGSENILSWGENQIVFSVPVGAVSASVQVLVGEETSNRVGFVVSSAFTQPQPEDFLADPETGVELVRGQILISFRPGTAQETIEGIISSVDGETVGYDPRMDVYQVAIPQTEPAEIDQVVNRLAELEEVTFVSPRLGSVGEQVDPVDGEYPPGAWDPGSVEPRNWGLRFINMPLAWDTTIGNAAVRAAVVDSGFDLGHEDLMGNIFIIGPGNSAADHGTHVAGIVGAQGNNGEGISGVNWQTGLCLFDYDYGTGESDWTSITNRMMEAIDRGARVINLSAGINWWRIRENQGRNPPDEEPLTPDEIAYSQSVGQLMARVPAYAAATNRDVLFVFSAGNDAIPAQFNGTTWVLPLFNNILVVANIEEDGSRADSSNYGPYVNIAAPGNEIYSTVARPQRYDDLSGTSMAAPHVTGLAALLWAMNPSLSANQVRDCILAGAASRGTPVWEKYEPALGSHGFYAIEAPKALDACRDKVPQPVFQPVPPWKQPAVIACIEDWIQKYTAAWNRLRPERAPWRIDQYGHLIGRLMEGYPPDDWITRWEGNRYKRIWYGYANASAPGVPRLRDYCGGKVDLSPVPVPPPVPPAPGTEPWNDPAVQDCIQKWMRVVEAYHNKIYPERAPWRFSEYGHIIGRLMSYQKPDNWDTVYEG
ncbi:MAG: S8 family serine peptidase, partial [Anaerolineae bacterium]